MLLKGCLLILFQVADVFHLFCILTPWEKNLDLSLHILCIVQLQLDMNIVKALLALFVEV